LDGCVAGTPGCKVTTTNDNGSTNGNESKGNATGNQSQTNATTTGNLTEPATTRTNEHDYTATPYDSGYSHGCSDAKISNLSERYINQPGKSPSSHTFSCMDITMVIVLVPRTVHQHNTHQVQRLKQRIRTNAGGRIQTDARPSV